MSIDLYLPRLLLWLDDRGREEPSVYTKLAPFAAGEGLDPGFVEDLVTVLEQQGYVQISRGLDDEPDSLITRPGRAQAQALREQRADPAARLRYAHNAVIKWMFVHHQGSLANLADFMNATESYFLGDHLIDTELVAAVRYLADRRLVAAAGGQDELRLTADGMDCAISGETVSDYLASRSAGSHTYNVQNSQGSIIGGQHQTVQQTNSFGFNPTEVSQLVHFASLVRQISPTLDLPEAEHAELVDGAQALELEAAAPTSEQGRLRQAADRVVNALGVASKVTSALTLLIEQGHKAYAAVFGG
jgi:hypothetical protein